MNSIKVYTMESCPYCEAAKKLLGSKGLKFEEVLVGWDDDDTWIRLEKKTGFKTMPQIFIGEKFIGGFNELNQLEKRGELDKMLRA